METKKNGDKKGTEIKKKKLSCLFQLIEKYVPTPFEFNKVSQL